MRKVMDHTAVSATYNIKMTEKKKIIIISYLNYHCDTIVIMVIAPILPLDKICCHEPIRKSYYLHFHEY